MTMKIIATEEHMATREVADAWHALGLEARDPVVANVRRPPAIRSRG